MIKAIIFDMDGVLVDSEPANNEQVSDFMAELGKRPSEEFINKLVGTSYEEASRRCIEYLGLDIEVKKFLDLMNVYIQKHPFSYADYLNEGVRDILEYLKAKEYQTAIASSSQIYQIQKMLKECNLESYFDLILSGEMFAESKPNPEIYLTAAKKLNLKPEECIVIEDSYYGIEAGKRAGMKVLALKDTRYGMDQSQADVLITHLTDIKKEMK